MQDPRAKHLRRLHRLRRSARNWTVRAGLLTGAAAVFVPYHGLGPWDALWASLAGGSVAMAGLRWSETRAFAALPVPEPVHPALAAERARLSVEAFVRRLPA